MYSCFRSARNSQPSPGSRCTQQQQQHFYQPPPLHATQLLKSAAGRISSCANRRRRPFACCCCRSCRHLAARTNVELRRTCAACVSDLMAAPLPGSSPFYLYDTWTDLAADHDEQVCACVHVCACACVCGVHACVQCASGVGMCIRTHVCVLAQACVYLKLQGLHPFSQVCCAGAEAYA